MNSLPVVKEKAREFRSAVLERSTDLFEGLVAELTARGYTVRAVGASIIKNADAVFTPADKQIRYNKELDKEPAKRLVAIAHEAGHIILHKRLEEERLRGVSPLSPYFNTGGPALARYNRRSREEIEADAFANEFVCPSGDVFEKWRSDPEVTSATIAKEYGISRGMAASRLAEGLFDAELTFASKPEKMKKLTSDDESQIKAARHTGSAALVNAGPGTGKTATLTMRVDYLLGKLDANPDEILILTFSNEAAEELRSRIEDVFGLEKAERIEITTFHGFGHAALLRWESDLDKEFVILDESRQEELVFELLGRTDCDPILHLREPLETARECVRQITKLKERRISPDELEERIKEWEAAEPDKLLKHRESRALLEIYRAYEAAKTEQNVVDFADLINFTLDILKSNPELVAEMRKQYKWVMVDEYQDVSRSVAELLGNICGPDNPPWVVGDLRQAIYVFCGAAPENVTNFPTDFVDVEVFELRKNYRSCDQVIEVANQFAEIMGLGDPPADSKPLWVRGSDEVRLVGEEQAIKVARAYSDASEYDGIARQVGKWLELIPAHEIAVLTRRNKDVRQVCIELAKRGVKVSTPGLITMDGTAGLMACVSSFIDAEAPSLPRVVYGLNARRFGTHVLDRAITLLRENADTIDLSEEPDGVAILIEQVERLRAALDKVKFKGDAFSVMCAFLFDGSDHLRRVLIDDNETRRSMEISELLSSLSWAVSYRYSHPAASARNSRIGFSQFFRGILAAGRPALIPPQKVEGAVQVMTCHASKGLEFPCVAVTGQTLSKMQNKSWLPPGIDSTEEEKQQADALLFVGATRSKRSLAISYAQTVQRKLPNLLVEWMKRYSIEPEQWQVERSAGEAYEFDAIWGLPQVSRRLSASSFDPSWCSLKVYVQDIYGGEFPTLVDSLYPQFFGSTRRAIGEIISRVASDVSVSDDEAAAIFIERFEKEWLIKHPLYEIYKRRGIAFVTGFLDQIESIPKPKELIETDEVFGGEIGGDPLGIRFGFIAHYKDQTGLTHAIVFRPESLKPKSGGSELNWSEFKKSNTAIILLRSFDENVTPWLYSGMDRKAYRLKWKAKGKGTPVEVEIAAIVDKRSAISEGRFEGSADEFWCETKCENRPNCPFWMKASLSTN
ncbi:MAG: UvrD-helicase domain-containing protein [Acidobacteria bacterium]|nr:UvrD-helicase domain-containing protein [Acidobacteriota bacterium]